MIDEWMDLHDFLINLRPYKSSSNTHWVSFHTAVKKANKACSLKRPVIYCLGKCVSQNSWQLITCSIMLPLNMPSFLSKYHVDIICLFVITQDTFERMHTYFDSLPNSVFWKIVWHFGSLLSCWTLGSYAELWYTRTAL